MAQASTHNYDYDTLEESVRRINQERSRRSWIAVILFALSAIGISASFYYSYRDVPAPASPANNAPGLTDYR